MGPEDKKWNGEEREFLHDLCNYLAISYGNAKLLQVKLGSNPNSMDVVAIMQKVEKIVSSFDNANLLLEKRRGHLKSKE